MDNVSVAVRIKPCLNKNGKSVECISTDSRIIFVPEKQVSYAFDHIFLENSTQEDVYNDMVLPLVRNVKNGFNSTIFAYGQTGTGKTFTIGSDLAYYYDNQAGLISRALSDIFSWKESKRISVIISFVEIYNEKAYDLLSKNNTALQIKGFSITGLTEQFVLTLQDAQHLLMEGGKNRHTGETKQNSKSSRSHAIFTIHCNVKHEQHETVAKLNLVDLAGSESIKKTGNEGSQRLEGININKGLLCIGQVFNALSNNDTHIPYRQSTITTILQDSLNKRNYVTLIACIGTNIEDLAETVQTLDFAQRAKRVKNKPELNSIISEYTKAQHSPTIMKYYTPYKQVMSTPMRNHSLTNIKNKSGVRLPSAYKPSNTSCLLNMPESFSPIVNKCIEKVGDSILNRLRDIVQCTNCTPISTKSPRISRRSLVREVSEMVRNKISGRSVEFNTFRNEINRERDRSSSIAGGNDRVEKENESYYANVAEMLEINDNEHINLSPIFKKPFTPPQRQGRKAVASTQQTAPENDTPRNCNRRSIRIRNRQSVTRINTSGISPKTKQRKSAIATSPKVNVRRSALAVTRSLRSSKVIANKGKAEKKIQKQTYPKSLSDSKHTTSVLKTLNNGNITDLMNLHTIGKKGATMIIQFRQIKGPFRKISELSHMPWRGNAYQAFVTSNFLVPETP